MRKQLTNQRMLNAAKQRLAEHAATRPATRAEADTIGQTHLDAAVELEADAKSVIYRPRSAAEIGRGEHAVSDQHQEGIRHSQSHTESLHLRSLAAKERLRAAAWECDSDDMAAIWEAARDEFQTRVDHYQRLVDDVESLSVDDRVEGGERGTEDHDTGRVTTVHTDGRVTVAWDSQVQTTQPAELLRRI